MGLPPKTITAQVEMLRRAPAELGIDVAHVGSRPLQTLGLLGLPLQDMLIFAENEAFLRQAARTEQVAGIVVPRSLLELAKSVSSEWWLIQSDSPRTSFWDLHDWLYREVEYYGSDSQAKPQIHPTAQVAPTAVVENGVELGAGSAIGAFVQIRAGVRIGKRVSIGSHSVIGAEGFQSYIGRHDRRLHVPHTGTVDVGDDVCIHSHVSICRAVWGTTRIGAGCQFDDHCHLAHNCTLGRDNIITAGTILGGSVTVGDNNYFGLNSTIKDGISIGSNCRIPMGALIVRSLQDEAKLAPLPALEPMQVGRLLQLARQRG